MPSRSATTPNPVSLRAFAAAVDVISFEFENVSAEGLDLLGLAEAGAPGAVGAADQPGPGRGKVLPQRRRRRHRPWRPVASLDDLHAAAAELGLPAVLKTTRLGYDGKGQRMLRDPSEFAGRLRRAGAEAADPGRLRRFRLRNQRGGRARRGRRDVGVRHRGEPPSRAYPGPDLAPARISAEIAAAAQAIARRVAEALDLVGLLAVEMFVDATGRVLVNEIAPRPHNSGHWTIDACPASQFELHIRAIAGLPLPPAVRHSDAVMKNLVGPEGMALWPAILATPGLDPASLRQGGGAPGPQDGPRDAAVPQGGAAGGVRRAGGDD